MLILGRPSWSRSAEWLQSYYTIILPSLFQKCSHFTNKFYFETVVIERWRNIRLHAKFAHFLQIFFSINLFLKYLFEFMLKMWYTVLYINEILIKNDLQWKVLYRSCSILHMRRINRSDFIYMSYYSKLNAFCIPVPM
jgi:hypothetical protein